MEKLKINPWVNMWVSPRKTIKAVVKSNPRYRFAFLSGFYGFPMMLHFCQNASLAEAMSLPGIIILSLVLSVFIGMLGLCIMSGLLYWTGKWIGGKASYIQVRAAVSWSNVTSVVNCLLWIASIVIFGAGLFFAQFPYSQFAGFELTAISTIYILQTVLAIWSFVLLLHALGEVHGFSAWKALLNVIIPFALVFVAIWLIATIAWWFNGMP